MTNECRSNLHLEQRITCRDAPLESNEIHPAFPSRSMAFSLSENPRCFRERKAQTETDNILQLRLPSIVHQGLDTRRYASWWPRVSPDLGPVRFCTKARLCRPMSQSCGTRRHKYARRRRVAIPCRERRSFREQNQSLVLSTFRFFGFLSSRAILPSSAL